MPNHEEQFPRHNKFQQHSNAKCSTHSEVAENKLKGKIDGYLGLARVGHQPETRFVAATACAENSCSTQDEIKYSNYQCSKQKQVITNWSTPESFHCLMAAVLEN